MTIAVGDAIPSVDLFTLRDGAPVAVSTKDLFAGRKVALFGVPGAFTRTCSAKHLPGFVAAADDLKAKGADAVMCLSVNDAMVMGAWGREHGADGSVVMLGDGLLDFTLAAGLESDMSAKGYGPRCRRFSMIVDDGVVTHMHLEAPGEFGATSAETLLGDL